MAKDFNKIKQKLELSDRLLFGKYYGAELRSLIIVAPTYFKWLVDNTDIKFSKESLDLYENHKPDKPALVKSKPDFTYYGSKHDHTGHLGQDDLDTWFDDVPF
jgi:hypothetical protein